MFLFSVLLHIEACIKPFDLGGVGRWTGVSFTILGPSTVDTLFLIKLYDTVDIFRGAPVIHVADKFPSIRPVGHGGDSPSCFIRATISTFVLQSA
jgi:hypothetical protein